MLIPCQTVALVNGVLGPVLSWVRPRTVEPDTFTEGLSLSAHDEERSVAHPLAVTPLVPAGSGGVRHHRTPDHDEAGAA